MSPDRESSHSKGAPLIYATDNVQRLMGKPPERWDSDDMVHLAREQGVRTVSLMHIGGDGWLKTLDFVPRSEAHLRDILEAGERADGSSLFKDTGIRTGASDIVLRPRLYTAFFDPFAPHPTLAFLCGHFGRDGEPLPESPDTILRRAQERVRQEAGVELLSLGEVEYFLGKRAEEGDVYGADDRGYHATSPFVFGEALRRKAMAILGDIRVSVKYGHSEVGYIEADEADGVIWEQHEIEMALRPLVDAAECVVMTQWVLRNLAHESGMRCSFDPILRTGHAGSGMHFHFSPWRNGEHLGGMDDEGALGDEARWLIGGLVEMGGALMAFGNRSKESFVRLSQGKEAPDSITWGRFNRHALVRLPIQAATPDGRTVTPPTIEFRLPDGSVHPYLLLAGVAQAMLSGKENGELDALLERTDAASTTLEGTASPTGARAPTSGVPKDFRAVAEALALHEESLRAGDVFPEGLFEATLKQLRAAE